MSTSGVTTFQMTATGIINSALRKLGVLSEGNAATAVELLSGMEALNSLIKLLMVKGMPIWAIKEYSFTTVANLNTYTIGNGAMFNTPMPLKVVQAYRTQSNGGVNIPMNIYTHNDYNQLPFNATSSTPIDLFYQPFVATGTIKLWPSPSDSSTTVTIIYQRPFEDVVSGSDTLDFPPYWSDSLIYNLSWRLCPEYGTPLQERQTLAKEADLFTTEALSFGTEEGSIYMSPSTYYRR